MTEEILFKEKDIVNKEYYDGIKEQVKCPICLDIVRKPVQCIKCQHFFCLVCSNNLKECPFRCNNKIFKDSIICKNLLSELTIKCQCGCEIRYDLFEKHKKEECMLTNYSKLKKRCELLEKNNNNINYLKLKEKYETLEKKYNDLIKINKKVMNFLKLFSKEFRGNFFYYIIIALVIMSFIYVSIIIKKQYSEILLIKIHSIYTFIKESILVIFKYSIAIAFLSPFVVLIIVIILWILMCIIYFFMMSYSASYAIIMIIKDFFINIKEFLLNPFN